MMGVRKRMLTDTQWVLIKKRLIMNKYQKKQIKGATMIEYVLIAGLIAVAAVAIMTTVGGGIAGLFTKVNTAITGT
jgi:pilus assembly protein Flp/PilA